MSNSRSADDIIRDMQQVRRELRADVAGIVDRAQDIVDRAQDMTDWRYYVRSYPLVCLGAAAVVGYLLVPTRVKHLNTRDQEVKLVTPTKEKSSVGTTLIATAGGIVTSLLMQAASTFAKQQLNQILNSSLDVAYPSTPGSPSQSTNGTGKHPTAANGGFS